jgi:murein DD-endopeptidase MepM/ murein hydrolase activator NlpD
MAHLRGVMLALTAVALLLPASPRGAADDWHVGVRPGLIQPGDVLKLDIRPPDGITMVTARWSDRDVPLVRQADGTWRGLFGIDAEMAPGPKVLALRGTRPTGPAVEGTHTFDVAPKAVRTRRIRVNPKFVDPPKSAWPRIQEETELLNALFRKPPSPERLWTLNAVRPVEGVAVSGFGVRSVLNGQPRGPHNGLDLAAVTGTPVYAPTPAVVVYARPFYYSGNTVILDHGHGLFSTMAHLSVIDVKEGAPVTQGALLGKVGATGRVTGPHLHWAVRLHGDRVDPLKLIQALAPAVSAR